MEHIGISESRHACGCGADQDTPELDARAIPHAIRHAAIFGALSAIQPGGALILIAPHDPLPLLAHITERYGEGFSVSYLERGPKAWRLRLDRD